MSGRARRVGVMRLVFAGVFAALALRLVTVQVLSGSRYAAMGAEEVTSRIPVPGLRGGIFDRNGGVLAVSVPRSDVVADPFLIHHPAAEAAALAPVLGMSVPSVETLVSEHSGYVVLASDVASTVAKRVTALVAPGISVIPTTQRIYPAGQLGRSVIGTVNWEGQGAAGIEYQYNKLLSGQSGAKNLEVSPSGIVIPGGPTGAGGARNGTGLELTIDEPLEYVAREALAAEVRSTHAVNGTAVVMDTQTGAILAMVNVATDPTTGQVVDAPSNLASTEVYEPGSVFKIVTFSASLENHIITPTTTLTVPPYLMIDGWRFHDAESHGTEQLTATQIIARSSNIGTIEITERLGKSRLAAQINNLGFGKPTGLHFPGASPGIVNNPANWSPSAIGSTPIGQDTGVTPLQVLDAMNSVANGGVFVPPHLVRATVLPGGSVRRVKSPAAHRVMPAWVAHELAHMLEQVVRTGTGVYAAVPGYTLAGKTGTSQIPSRTQRGYVPGAYMATFTGFAPAGAPRLSAVVVLDRPDNYYGGSAAAPVFSEIMRYALHRYGIPGSPDGGTTGGVPRLIPYPPPAPAAVDTRSPRTPGTIVATTGNVTEGP